MHSKSSLATFLLLLTCAWMWLIFYVPYLGERYPNVEFDPSSNEIRLSQEFFRFLNEREQELRVNLETGRTTWSNLHGQPEILLNRVARSGRAQVSVYDSGNRPPEHGKFRVIWGKGDSIKEQVIAIDGSPQIVSDRFLVSVSERLLNVVEFAASNQVRKSALKFSGYLHKPIDGRNRLLFSSLNTNTVQLIQIDDDLGWSLIGSWPIFEFSTHQVKSFAIANGHIVSVNPETQSVEYRNLHSGNLEEWLPVPSEADFTAQQCGFTGDFLYFKRSDGQFIYLDLEKRKWLPPVDPTTATGLPEKSDGNRYVLFRGYSDEKKSKASIYDWDTGLFHSVVGTGVWREFIDQNRLLFFSRSWGCTVQLVDPVSGNTLKIYRPFWWAAPFAILLLSAYLVLSIRWMHHGSSRGSLAIWRDVGIICAVPLILAITRYRFVGIENDNRLSMLIGLSIVFAATLSSIVWLILSLQRPVTRCVPALLCFATIFGVLGIDEENLAERASILAVLFAILLPMIIFALVLRMFSVRFSRFADGEIPVIRRNYELSVRDLFLLLASLAILLASSKRWLPQWSDMQLLTDTLGEAFLVCQVVVIPTLAGWMLGIAKKRFRRTGVVAFFGILTMLIIVLTLNFASSFDQLGGLAYLFQIYLTLPTLCFLASFWVSNCFRCKQWQLVRIPGSRVRKPQPA